MASQLTLLDSLTRVKEKGNKKGPSRVKMHAGARIKGGNPSWHKKSPSRLLGRGFLFNCFCYLCFL